MWPVPVKCLTVQLLCTLARGFVCFPAGVGTRPLNFRRNRARQRFVGKLKRTRHHETLGGYEGENNFFKPPKLIPFPRSARAGDFWVSSFGGSLVWGLCVPSV